MKSKKGRRPVKPVPSVELVVRRGALKRFRQLKQKTQNLPVEVLWDRRTGGDRRSGATTHNLDQRKAERRQPPPYTWNVADFVVVERPRKARAKKIKP